MADESRSEPEIDEPQLRRRTEPPNEIEEALSGLVDRDPAAFLKLAGLPTTGEVRVVDAGIFPSVLPIDYVLRVTDEKPWVAIVALATSRDPDIVYSVHVMLTTLMVMFRKPMALVPYVVLVRPEADDQTIVGELSDDLPDGEVNFRFRYHAIRAWQHPPESPLGDTSSEVLETLTRSGLPALIAELRDRAVAGVDADSAESAMCLVFAFPKRGRVDRELKAFANQVEETAPCVLLSLDRRSDPRIASREEGCAVMRWKLYQLGMRKFGIPDARIASEISAITSPRRLTDLDHFLGRIDSQNLPIKTWDDLLAWRPPDE